MTWLSTRVEIGTITAPICSRLRFWSWAGGGWSASDGFFEPHKIAASFASGRPVDLSAVVTNSLGWAHARRVAEAVTTTDGPSRSFSQPCSATRQMKTRNCAAAWEAAPAAPGRPACRCEKPDQGAAAPKTRTPGSAAVVEGHLVAVGVRERESAAERPVDGR